MGKKHTQFRVNVEGLGDTERWYALTTSWNYESFVIERIIDMNKNLGMIILDTFTPTVERLEQRGKKTKLVKEKLMPNYVFIKTKLTVDVYKLIMNISGVVGFMCMGGVPAIITEKDIDNIKNKMSDVA